MFGKLGKWRSLSPVACVGERLTNPPTIVHESKLVVSCEFPSSVVSEKRK